MLDLLRSPAFWANASIPVVAGLVGWFTNWVAIVMTFRPLEFRGIPPWLGWQGIIPSKAGKMAAIFVDRTMFRLGTLRELFELMDPERIAEHVTTVVDRRLEGWVDEVMYAEEPGLWRLLPEPLKRSVVARVRERLPRLLADLLAAIAEDVEELIDFKHMLVTRLENDKALLNRLFLESGAAELRFIVRSGLWFGIPFGLVQLGVWLVYPAWWILPLFGGIVGWATNWLALNIVFRPLEPRRVGPFVVQGIFLKRQREVAAVWCRIVTTQILTLQHIAYEMLYGPRSGRVRELVRAHIAPVVDEVAASYAPLSGLTVGEESLASLRDAVGAKAVAVSADPFDHWPFNRERSAIIEELLRERMERLPPAEFQDLLRPCFQEDEAKLVAAGAVLGLLAGAAQVAFVF